MYAVGLRELKAKLSEYVRRARAGEVVLVTDRGQVVAELRPPSLLLHDDGLGELHELVLSGALKRGLPHDPQTYSPSDLALEESTSETLLSWTRGGETEQAVENAEDPEEGGGQP
jgi:antitoxin (DNA-binding transcriptional repressor) of toxin-antitoxin stability system